MKSEEQKQIKHVVKQVDKVMSKIKDAIPCDYTPNQVSAIFNLYLSMYE